MATNEEMKVEFSFFGEVWFLFKKYYIVQNTDEYWETLIAESDRINRKYNSELCKDLLLAVINELERRAKGNNQKEGKT